MALRKSISPERAKYLEDLAKSYGVHVGCEPKFCCPLCLKVFPIDSSEISIEHILPQQAGGGGEIETFLCDPCNSTNGSKITDQFGKFLNYLIDDESPTRKNPYLGIKKGVINEIEQDFAIVEAEDGALEINRRFKNRKHAQHATQNDNAEKITIQFSVPTENDARLAEIGFLAAGYLLLFKEFGYSWVLQSHLDPVRNAISSPEGKSIPSAMIHDTGLMTPAIGFIEISGHSYPAANILGLAISFDSFSGSYPIEGNPDAGPFRLTKVKGHLSQAAGPKQSWISGKDVLIYPDLANSCTEVIFHIVPRDVATNS